MKRLLAILCLVQLACSLELATVTVTTPPRKSALRDYHALYDKRPVFAPEIENGKVHP